jgi:transcriptional regulator with GAF, ATPase, and Fis domain
MLELSLPDKLSDHHDSAQAVAAVGTEVLTEKQMRDLQKRNIVAALKQTNWQVSGESGAAALLGTRPTTLSDRIKAFGIRKPRSQI